MVHPRSQDLLKVAPRLGPPRIIQVRSLQACSGRWHRGQDQEGEVQAELLRSPPGIPREHGRQAPGPARPSSTPPLPFPNSPELACSAPHRLPFVLGSNAVGAVHLAYLTRGKHVVLRAQHGHLGTWFGRGYSRSGLRSQHRCTCRNAMPCTSWPSQAPCAVAGRSRRPGQSARSNRPAQTYKVARQSLRLSRHGRLNSHKCRMINVTVVQMICPHAGGACAAMQNEPQLT